MFPDDATLLARGKYSTLNHERRQQLERIQGICRTIMDSAGQILRDAEKIPPVDITPMETIDRCMKNLTKARTELVEVCEGLVEVKPTAWPK